MKKEDFRTEMIWNTAQFFCEFMPFKTKQKAQKEIASELKELFYNENVKTHEDAARIFKETYPHLFEWANIMYATSVRNSNMAIKKWIAFIGMVLLVSVIICIWAIGSLAV